MQHNPWPATEALSGQDVLILVAVTVGRCQTCPAQHIWQQALNASTLYFELSQPGSLASNEKRF